jgi:hypothetical protein
VARPVGGALGLDVRLPASRGGRFLEYAYVIFPMQRVANPTAPPAPCLTLMTSPVVKRHTPARSRLIAVFRGVGPGLLGLWRQVLTLCLDAGPDPGCRHPTRLEALSPAPWCVQRSVGPLRPRTPVVPSYRPVPSRGSTPRVRQLGPGARRIHPHGPASEARPLSSAAAAVPSQAKGSGPQRRWAPTRALMP